MSHRVGLAVALAAGFAMGPAPVEAQSGWTLEVEITDGPLTPAEARPALEARLAAIAECAPGAGPYQLTYTLSVGASGGVRSAAADRSVSAELAPPRAVRCVRHELEALELPERAEASHLVVTLAIGTPGSPSITAGPSASPPAPPGASAASSAGASVTLGSLVVAGSRSVASLRATLETGRPSLHQCYAAALVDAPDLGGQGALHLTIAPEGRVVRALFAGSEALAGAMALCLGTAARAWTFPAGDGEVRVEVPLEFAAP